MLSADGPGDTYELITSILAPNQNPIEAPDCNHEGFGRHIDEVFDVQLDANVFRFYIHTEPDNDRCINFDRQRNEIKSYDRSPDDLLGTENEKVVYKWKFKLAEGFQSSPNFTHLHQLKSVGGSLASMPMYTLTTRKGNPDRLELRYAETDKQVTLSRTDLAPFIDTWLEVTETILYGAEGTYDIEIRNLSDDSVLFSHTEESIINWRSGAEFVRPKWGIYRSLINAQDLRDEIVLYADFSIEEIQTTGTLENKYANLEIFPVPANRILSVKSTYEHTNQIKIFSMGGKEILSKVINPNSDIKFDVSAFQEGVYVLSLQGKNSIHSKLFIVAH